MKHLLLMMCLLTMPALGCGQPGRTMVDIADTSLTEGMQSARFTVTVAQDTITIIGEKKVVDGRIFYCQVSDPLGAQTITAYGPCGGYPFAHSVELYGFDSAGADITGPAERIQDPQTGHTYTGDPKEGPVGGLFSGCGTSLFRLSKVIGAMSVLLQPVLPETSAKDQGAVSAEVMSTPRDPFLKTASGTASVYVAKDGVVRMFRCAKELKDDRALALVSAAARDPEVAGRLKWLSEGLDLVVVQMSHNPWAPNQFRCFRGDASAAREVRIDTGGHALLLDVALVDGREQFLFIESTDEKRSLVVRSADGDVVASVSTAKDYLVPVPGNRVSWWGRFGASGKEVLVCRVEGGTNAAEEWSGTAMTFARWTVASNEWQGKRLDSASLFDRTISGPAVKNAVAPSRRR